MRAKRFIGVMLLVGLVLIGAAASHQQGGEVIALIRPVLGDAIHALGRALGAVSARRFVIEAILLAVVAGLHLALLLVGREPGQKLRRVELTIITLYLAVIVVNLASVCVGSLGGGEVA
ncbi:hypothetical protein [Caulobacter sp. FWC26]|uniref:hypothetical protein n=1 Tax=Caulobacter sp. FWC26 TaxID=69665 RepID=UPI000C150DD5|nr:hypothetical protein [Caulobacter sp. FWC26]AZS19401.1 hypothetical protein CSW63_01370 [Caulobacter sp. FWC26]